MKLSEVRKLYFLGIGGIGMSAIARYFLNEGKEIYGYDLTETALTKKLEAEGMHIHYDINPDKIPRDIDGVIITPAIPDNNEELRWLRSNGYGIKKRAEVLGELSRDKKSVAIAGTHGKTTTSSLLSHILTYCGLDISAFLGGILVKEKTNFLHGNSKWVVLEADEYDRSFLHCHPDILVIISMDADHLDIYGTYEEMIKSYEQLCCQIKAHGKLITKRECLIKFSDGAQKYFDENDIEVIVVGEDFVFDNIRIESARYRFDYKCGNQEVENVMTQLPGVHNVYNSALAIRVAHLLGLRLEEIKRAIGDFRGIKRRFEWVYDEEKVLLDDYAHHPEEVKYAVKTVKELYPDRYVLGVFQPHLYSRTKDFYREFAEELGALDEVWLLQVYPARELPMKGVESELIYNLIPSNNKRLVHTNNLITELDDRKDLDIVMTLGASDLDKYHHDIKTILKKKN